MPLRRAKKAKPHVHTGHSWDGFFEHCKCGASSGDRKDANGRRHISFSDWGKK